MGLFCKKSYPGQDEEMGKQLLSRAFEERMEGLDRFQALLSKAVREGFRV